MNETMLVMVAVSLSCALPGNFLVLRKMVLVGDAISHVLLLGIVLAYFVTHDPASPLLFLGAAAIGAFTVAVVEALQRTQWIKEDAAIGLVFPALFSAGTLLASLYLRNTHLDVDRVLLGSAELSYLDQLRISGRDLGPRGFYIPMLIMVIHTALLVVFFKIIKLSTFDPALAMSMGFRPTLVHYALMFGVSMTTVASFDAVGPVLVLAFFAIPPVMARLLTNRLKFMIIWSLILSVMAAVIGTNVAIQFDITIAGTVTSILGLQFCLIYLFAPEKGLISEIVRRIRAIRELHETLLVVHLLRHEGTPEEYEESAIARLHLHLQWDISKANQFALSAMKRGWIYQDHDQWKLTLTGRMKAQEMQ